MLKLFHYSFYFVFTFYFNWILFHLFIYPYCEYSEKGCNLTPLIIKTDFKHRRIFKYFSKWLVLCCSWIWILYILSCCDIPFPHSHIQCIQQSCTFRIELYKLRCDQLFKNINLVNSYVHGFFELLEFAHHFISRYIWISTESKVHLLVFWCFWPW
jgi:hypothetical protein